MRQPSRSFVVALTACLAAALLAWRGAAAPAAAGVDARTTEANIAGVTTTLLEQSQFSHHPLDAAWAGKFLDRYLDALDGGHALFLQSDVDEFSAQRTTIARATRDKGDTTPAHTIFARYLQRLGQQVDYLTKALDTMQFAFAGDDVYALDRGEAARPRDLAAARELWRQQLRAEYLQEKLADKKPRDIVTTLTRRYNQQLRTMKALTRDEVVEVYLNALAHVYDPHSDYLGHQQMESLSISMKLSLFGIGASLETDDGYCTIRELIPGGPAAKSGKLKPGDRIVAVAQGAKQPVDIVNMPLSRAVELIRGPKGSTVVLTIIPAGDAAGAAHQEIRLVRDVIKLEDQQAKAQLLELRRPDNTTLRVGVIDLPSFYSDLDGAPGSVARGATTDVARLLKKLNDEHVKGVILDLRRNGGGSLDEAINLTGLFIRKGPVVQTRGPRGDIEVGADKDPAVAYDGPLVVMTSRFSASASEIVAGALQDYGRALVVGDTATFGKGTVQSVLPLASIMDQNGLPHAYDPGALKVTIRKFYRPSGASTQLRGVSADIVLPSTSDFNDISESALKDPLPWDTVPAATYERRDRVGPYLAALRQQSARRVAADKGFALLAVDIARVRKSLTGKVVSLNEAQRRRELAEGKAQKALWQKESAAQLANRPTTYDITLRAAAAPGLPAPSVPKVGQKGDDKKSDDKKNDDKNSLDQREDDDESWRGHSPADELILREGEQILADYVTAQERDGAAERQKKGTGAPPRSSAPNR